MKAWLFIIACTVLFYSSSLAQVVTSLHSGGGYIENIQTDPEGNVYVAINANNATLAGITYPNQTSQGYGIAKFDRFGQHQWSCMSTKGPSWISNMDVDARGNVLFVAKISDSLIWGGQVQTRPQGVGNFVKSVVGLIDSTGTLVWLRGSNNLTWDVGENAKFMPNGNILWGCGFKGPATINGYNIPPTDSIEGYLMTLNRSGVVQSAYHLDGLGKASFSGAVANQLGEIWYVGAFHGSSATFQGNVIQGSATTTRPNMFFGKLDANGVPQWTLPFNSACVAIHDLALDDNGNLYYAGETSANVGLGGLSVNGPLGVGRVMFAGKITPAGTAAWIVPSISQSYLSFLSAIDYHSSGKILLGGIVQSGSGTFAGLPYSATTAAPYYAVLDTTGNGIFSLQLDPPLGFWGYKPMVWSGANSFLIHGYTSPQGSNFLGNHLPPVAGNYNHFWATISMDYNSVHGFHYADLDVSGTYNAGDAVIPYQGVTTSSGPVSVTDSLGNFKLFLGQGQHTVTTQPTTNLFTLSPPSHLINFTGYGAIDSSVVFRSTPQSIIPDLRLDLIAPGFAQPGFTTTLNLLSTNLGSQAGSGKLTLELDPGMSFLGANPVPDTIQGTRLVWNQNPIAPFSHELTTVSVWLDTMLQANIALECRADLQTLVADFDPNNQTDTTHTIVVTSYDPNDKSVSPETAPSSYINSGGKLQYTVRFQNTGSAPAHRVIIRDTLSNDLDVSTIRLVGSSHPVTMSLYENKYVHWVFNPILLPGYSTDPAGSQGFVLFEIGVHNGVVSGDSISNRVGIYFDYNAPIITNDAVFHVLDPVGIPPEESLFDLVIYPNPGKDLLKIAGIAEDHHPITVDVLDLQGRLIQTMGFPEYAPELTMPVELKAQGVFLVRITTHTGIQQTYRWIAE